MGIINLSGKEARVPVHKLEKFLDGKGINYVRITHSAAYTAQKTVAAAHIPGKALAKTVILKVDGKMMMAILPASRKLDLSLLKEAVGVNKVEMANETEFKDMFPECEIGAIPPFGNLYGMDVISETILAENEVIAFNAGSHTEVVKLSYKDFLELVKPKVATFSSMR
jgi:Ala-tRNA(Pro) deacylase